MISGTTWDFQTAKHSGSARCVRELELVVVKAGEMLPNMRGSWEGVRL